MLNTDKDGKDTLKALKLVRRIIKEYFAVGPFVNSWQKQLSSIKQALHTLECQS
jgi:hypothetical protein